MKCENTKRGLSEYLDGVLPDEEHAAVETHVAGCTGCRAELDALRRTVEAVAGLPHHRAPAGFSARVAARVHAEAVARPGRGARIMRLWPRLAAVAAMFILAAGITFLVDGGLWLPGRPDGDRVAMQGGREAPALTPDGGVAGTGLTHNGTAGTAVTRDAALGFDDASLPDEAEERRLADDKRATTLQYLFNDRSADAREKREFAFGDRLPPKSGSGGIRYEHDSTMAGARSAGNIRSVRGLPVKMADFDVDQPHQVLMLQDSRPILLATQAMDIAARNDGRFDLALVPQGDRGDEIVLVLCIPVEQYEAFLSQVTDLVPMRQQRLNNTMVTEQEPYFQDVLVNYYEQQTGEPIAKLDWEALDISGTAGPASGPAKPLAAQRRRRPADRASVVEASEVLNRLATDVDGDAVVAKATTKSKLRQALRESAAAHPGVLAKETLASEAGRTPGKAADDWAPEKLEAEDLLEAAGAEGALGAIVARRKKSAAAAEKEMKRIVAGGEPVPGFRYYSRAREGGKDLRTAKPELDKLSEKRGTGPSRVRLIIRLMREAPEPTER